MTENPFTPRQFNWFKFSSWLVSGVLSLAAWVGITVVFVNLERVFGLIS